MSMWLFVASQCRLPGTVQELQQGRAVKFQVGLELTHGYHYYGGAYVISNQNP